MTIRKTFSFLTIMLLASATHAQITAGAKIGANINQFNQPGTVFGFTGGAFGKYQVKEFLGVRLEVLYNQQGGARQNYNRDYSEIGGNVDFVYLTNRYVTLHNLEVPLLLELSHPSFSDETIKPKLLLGAAYAANLSAIEHHEKTYYFNDGPSSNYFSTVTVSDLKENVGSNYKLNQWGFIVGFGVEMKAGEHTCTLEVRYRKSLSQLNNIRFGVAEQDGLPGTIGHEGDLYSSTITIGFGISIFNF